MTAATSAYLNQPTRSLAEAAYETDRHARPPCDLAREYGVSRRAIEFAKDGTT